MDQERHGIRGLFIVYDDLSASNGVNKKIKNQIAAFQKAGFDMEPYTMPSATGAFLYKLRYRLPFSNLSPRWRYDDRFDGVDFIYLRRPFFLTVWALRFFRKLKRRNPGVKIVYELPTYPYDLEITERKRNLPVYWKDVICRQFLRRYVDRISNLGPEQEVFGIPVIRIRNGYDFSTIRPRRPKTETGTIDIAVVACFDIWHGYERLIESLHKYYTNGGTRNIVLHFVGDGPEKAHYTQLVDDNDLNKQVIFYGMRTYDELMEIYDTCDLGASSFGLYKIGINYGCTLKTREYLAKGLPILCGGRIDINEIPGLGEYVLNFANDDSLLDINKVVSFYDSLYADKTATEIMNMVETIRDLAEKNLNMQQSLMPVIDYIYETQS